MDNMVAMYARALVAWRDEHFYDRTDAVVDDDDLARLWDLIEGLAANE